MKNLYKKLNRLLLSAVLITVGSSFIFGQEIREETIRVITDALGNDVTIDVEKFILPTEIKKEIEYSAQQRFFGDFVYFYKITSEKKDTTIGFLDNVYGKAMPITFFVLMKTDGSIISTNIIKYREQYGGAVSNKSWNDQFTGKNGTSDFTIGESVNSISGATISVNAVTKGIKKIILLYEAIKDSI
jgi:Na+-translocating ferredoxin:NAD+ oxidoreductase RnfG subunit